MSVINVNMLDQKNPCSMKEKVASETQQGPAEHQGIDRGPEPLSMRLVLASLVISSSLRALLATLRWRVFEADKIRGTDAWGEMGPRILVIWHNQQIPLPALYFKSKRAGFRGRVFALISQHRDGRLAADIVRRLGIESVAGSSTRGGRAALSELCKLVSEGHVAVITPDGPKGPIYQLKPGAIKLAQISGAPIYPIAINVASKISLKSWDRLFLPRPFTQAVFLVGEPLHVPAELNEDQFEALRVQLEKNLKLVSEAAQKHFQTK